MTEGADPLPSSGPWMGSPVCESTDGRANDEAKIIAKQKTVKESVDFVLSVMQNVKENNYTLPYEGNFYDIEDIAYLAMNFHKGHRLKRDTWEEVAPYGPKKSTWEGFKRRLLPVACLLSALVTSWLIPMILDDNSHLAPLKKGYPIPIATSMHKSGSTFIIFLATTRLITGGYMLIYERLILKEKTHDFLENLMLAVFIPAFFEMLANLDILADLPGGNADASGGLKTLAVIVPVLLMTLVPFHATWNMCHGWMLILTVAGPKALGKSWRKFPGEDGWILDKPEEVDGPNLQQRLQTAAEDGLRTAASKAGF